MKKRILFIVGTRPEAIKMAPIYLKFKKEKRFESYLCNTGQHKQMVNDVFNFFNIIPDFDLKIMTKNQSLIDLVLKLTKGLKKIFDSNKFDLVLVQGDTSSVFIGSLISL